MSKIFHYENWFKPEECKEIIAYALSLPCSKGSVMSGASSIHHKMRECEIRWLNRSDYKLASLCSRIDHLYTDAQINEFGMRDMFGYNEMQFTTYCGSDKSHYDFHVDNGTPKKGGDRRLSMVILLSDPSEFEGGQFEMKPRANPSFLTKQGDVLFFKSDIEHRVLPVTEGTRHSIVVWFYGAHI